MYSSTTARHVLRCKLTLTHPLLYYSWFSGVLLCIYGENTSVSLVTASLLLWQVQDVRQRARAGRVRPGGLHRGQDCHHGHPTQMLIPLRMTAGVSRQLC
jgi:hypothetical protein